MKLVWLATLRASILRNNRKFVNLSSPLFTKVFFCSQVLFPIDINKKKIHEVRNKIIVIKLCKVKRNWCRTEKNDIWHMRCDLWNVTCDLWHITCDTMCHLIWGEHSPTISTAWDLWLSKELEEKDHWIKYRIPNTIRYWENPNSEYEYYYSVQLFK